MHDDFWRSISGYPNYLVSREGEVRSLTRNRLLAQVRGPRGYHTVNLYRNGRPRCCLVHRLVATAFLGVIPTGLQVNHKDGRKDNNCLDNLEIVTAEANRLHARQKGLLRVGEANHKAHLTEKGVRDVRRMRVEGARVRDIAHKYDVSERAIYLVCRRLTWKHIA